jgi:hypothetical protein
VLGPERRISPSLLRAIGTLRGRGKDEYSTWTLCNKHVVVVLFVSLHKFWTM